MLALTSMFGVGAWIFSDFRFLIPLACLTPLLVFALRADLERAVRSLWVELAAQGAFAGLAAAILVAGGDRFLTALRAWWFITLVGAANLAHVRRFLGQAHGLAPADLRRRWLPVHLFHLLLLLSSLACLTGRGLPGRLWAGWTLLLYLRALAPYRPTPARRLGWREGGLSMVGLLLLWQALR